MAVPVIIPKQGQTVESCIITKWLKSIGDKVNQGDDLFEYETDKATFSEPAEISGTLLTTYASEGEDVPCLELIAVIGEDGEDISEFKKSSFSDEEPGEVQKMDNHFDTLKSEDATEDNNSKSEIFVSPRARNAAKIKKVDLSLVKPTGPYGRIIEQDIKAFVKQLGVQDTDKIRKVADEQVYSSDTEYDLVPLTNIRKTIAKTMTASLSEMAQLTHNFSFDASNILNYRKMIKESGQSISVSDITINDMLLFAVSRIVLDFPELNANFVENELKIFKHVHIGMAVDTPRGLLVPTIFNADKLSLNDISFKTKEAIALSKSGEIYPDKLKGASLTISNLGVYGVESFTPIINPPQVCILGVCNIQYKIKKDGSTYPAMGLSLTYDHRVVDGGPASRFMQALCRALENFNILLAK